MAIWKIVLNIISIKNSFYTFKIKFKEVKLQIFKK